MPPIDFSKIQQFSKIELFAKQVVEGFITGLHKSPFHGFSVEFAEHRLYNTGESTRHIDWKLFARSDKLFVKRYEEETNLRCQIVLDHSSSMYFPFDENKPLEEQDNKIKFSVHCAAALIELLKRQRDAVGLSMFSNEIDMHLSAKSSPMHHKMLFNELEKTLTDIDSTHDKKSFAAKALNQVAEVINRRSLVVIFSDMFESSDEMEQVFSALQHLKHKKHEVVLFHVCDKSKELEFDFENRPYRFIDMETGVELKLNPTEIRTSYLEKINKLKSDLKLKCAQFKIDFVEADIHEGFEKVLHAYLAKRNSML